MFALGIIGIAIGLALLIYMSYKGFEAAYIAIFAVIIVAVFNHLNIQSSIADTMLQAAGGFFGGMAGMFVTSCIFAGIFSACGAAQSLANGLSWFIEKLLGKKAKTNPDVGIWITVLVSFFAMALLKYFGLDGMSATITIVPVAVALLKRYNLPRKAAPVLMFVGMAEVFLPYSLETTNLLPAMSLGTSTGAGGWPAVVVAVVAAIVSIIYVIRYIKKLKDSGIRFEANEKDALISDENSPNFILAIIPLAVVFILYTVAKLNIAIALIIATAACLLLMFNNFKLNADAAGTTSLLFLRDKIGQGAAMAGRLLVVLCMLVGFGSVVQATDVFNQVIGYLCSGHSAIFFICAAALCVAILVSCNPVAGEAIAINVLSKYFIEAGVPAAVFHRLTVVASTTFDSLPTGMGVIMAHELTGVSMKDGYKPVFVVTVLIPLIATFVLAAIYTAIPGAA